MRVTRAATRHSSLSNGRSALKQEVKSLCLKVRNPAGEEYNVSSACATSSDFTFARSKEIGRLLRLFIRNHTSALAYIRETGFTGPMFIHTVGHGPNEINLLSCVTSSILPRIMD
jgi:hypothetical protein